ncbi:helix-turn-helix domain-containing protein [Deinococcus aestuarii]|uniref:helix-turn-helix domain-containing protein n=1 Tax=Deinococcus aestuarii TaxID=2774531 RepID=UPI001C0E3D54|nr:helix-turn-helix transcriptional regulator [Deinococcus aestuarii]
MNERLKAKMELAASLLNDDGTVTPADRLPEGLLTQESRAGIEADYQDALNAENLAHAWKIARQRAQITAKELARRRQLTKGRLSQIENASHNPTVTSLAEHADALGYTVKVVLVPRHAGQRIEVPIYPHAPQAAD